MIRFVLVLVVVGVEAWWWWLLELAPSIKLRM
jgi:hypothetical protein